MRIRKLFLTAFIVMLAGVIGSAGPQDIQKKSDGQTTVQEPLVGKKICGYPRPEGVPQEVWENACEACTSVPVGPGSLDRRHADQPLVRRRLRDPDQGRARARRTRPAPSGTS